MMSLATSRGPCAFCGSVTSENCSFCRKDYYCTHEHQQMHYNEHHPDCYPAQVQSDSERGRFLVATRDIKCGEIIFIEKAIVQAPNSGGAGFLPLCLGCCRTIEPEAFCKRCVWPLCSSQCSMIYWHQNFECPILSKNNVLPSGRPDEYEFIKILRCLLLAEKDSVKWSKLMTLESHVVLRAARASDIVTTQAVFKFLTEECNLKNFEYHIINFVVGVSKINSLNSETHAAFNYHRMESGIYHKASMLSHDCTPNCRLVMLEPPPYLFWSPSYSLLVMAATEIRAGGALTISYVNNLEDTASRQQTLKDLHYFTCNCTRCSDSTEFKTTFGGIKCPSKGCTDGIVLPSNARMCNSPWRCSKCDFVRSQEEVNGFLYALQLSIQDANDLQNSVESVKRFQFILKENESSTVQKNHYLMILATQDMLVKMLDILCTAKEPNVLHCTSKQMIIQAKKCLRIANIFCKGLTVIRGRLLYYMARGLKVYTMMTYALSRDERMRNSYILEMNAIAKESKEILEFEPSGSVERLMAQVLASEETYVKINGVYSASLISINPVSKTWVRTPVYPTNTKVLSPLENHQQNHSNGHIKGKGDKK